MARRLPLSARPRDEGSGHPLVLGRLPADRAGVHGGGGHAVARHLAVRPEPGRAARLREPLVPHALPVVAGLEGAHRGAGAAAPGAGGHRPQPPIRRGHPRGHGAEPPLQVRRQGVALPRAHGRVADDVDGVRGGEAGHGPGHGAHAGRLRRVAAARRARAHLPRGHLLPHPRAPALQARRLPARHRGAGARGARGVGGHAGDSRKRRPLDGPERPGTHAGAASSTRGVVRRGSRGTRRARARHVPRRARAARPIRRGAGAAGRLSNPLCSPRPAAWAHTESMRMSAPRRANRKAFRSVICLVLVLLGASLPLPALADDRWRIQGRLLDEKGAPVANGPVGAFCTGALPEGPFIDCGFPGLMGRQTRTGADGGFSLERLPPAIYSLYSALEAPGQGVTAEASLAIQLRQTQEGLELRLKRRVPAPREDEPRKSEEGWELQALSGQVVDSTGAPIRHVRVRAELDGPPERSREKYGSGYAISEDFGRFKIQGLREGTYRLEVSAEGFLTQKTVVRTSDEPRTFQLKRGGLVRGQAVKPDGSAVEKLNSDCREGYRSRLPEGRFEVFTYDESGAMRLCLSAPGMARVQRQLTLPPEQVLELGDVRMEPARPMKVRVTDLRTGAPVPWAKVTVVGAEPSARPLLTLDDGGARIQELPHI